MDLSNAFIHEPLWVDVVRLFCVIWPFVAFRCMRPHGRSAAPLLAMMLPLLASSCGVWLGLTDVLWGMAITNTGSERWIVAGVAEAFALLRIASYSAAAVAMVALIRRHRLAVDRATWILAALALAQIAVAAALGANLRPRDLHWYGAWSGAGATALLLIAAALRLAHSVRRPHSSRTFVAT